MTVKYQKVWRTMNDLEMVTSKICSAREIIDNAIDKIQEHQNDKAELLMTAAYEFLEYYLQEFDEKFKLAWQATVGDLRDGDKEAYNAVIKERDYYEPQQYTEEELSQYKVSLSCDKDDSSPECKGAWDDFWENVDQEHEYNLREAEYYDKRAKLDIEYGKEKKKWVLPVQQSYIDGLDDCFVYFPDDLLEAAKLKEGDTIEWVDNKDGTYTLRKVTKPLTIDEC